MSEENHAVMYVSFRKCAIFTSKQLDSYLKEVDDKILCNLVLVLVRDVSKMFARK